MPKAVIIILAIGICLGFAAADYWGAPNAQPSSSVAPALSSAVVDFEFTDIHEVPRKLSDYRGKIVFLNFWATWCTPCVTEMPDLLEMARRGGNDIVLLGVSVDQETETVQKFLDRISGDDALPENVVFALDPDLKISLEQFGSEMFPETFIIGPNGNILRKVTGVIDWLSPEIDKLIAVHKE